MATTLRRRDHMLRLLANATPGTTDPALDFLGRVCIAGNLDYMGRPLTAPAWIAATVYAAGAIVTEVATGKVLQATVGGTSDAAEPTAPGHGETVEDNTVTWVQITG
ncbi:MAG TPA: hypothetical protein VJQ79_05960 [Acidimicrobiia bacterium]|nr:hypothetical protein [Acidimicrobiia bacterium]